MRRVILIGDSGHAKVIEDIINGLENIEVIARLDDKYDQLFKEENLYKGPTSELNKLLNTYPESKVVIAIGSNLIRKKIVDSLKLEKEQYMSFIHPSAVVSPAASIGHGTVVMPNAVVNANASIGNHVIINSGAVVEHDSRLEDYVHISPLAAITGAVRIQ